MYRMQLLKEDEEFEMIAGTYTDYIVEIMPDNEATITVNNG